MRRLISLLVLSMLPVSAKPTVIHLEWNEFREMTQLVRFRKTVTVRTGEDGLKRTRMKFAGISDSEITLAGRSRRIAIRRDEVHSVRISPRWGNPLMWRLIASAAAFPLWLAGLTFGLSIPGGIPEGRWHSNRHTPQGLAVGFGLPVAAYLLAHRIDRRNGAIIIRLEQGKEKRK